MYTIRGRNRTLGNDLWEKRTRVGRVEQGMLWYVGEFEIY